jgi:hypothetical protein
MEICAECAYKLDLFIIRETFKGLRAVAFTDRFAYTLNECEELWALLANQALA